jgi:iron complex transport system substrate-binding protein
MRHARIVLGLLVFVACTVAACKRSGDVDRSRTGSAGSTSGGSGTDEMRIVSLTPSATELVAAPGATSSLVGVDEYSKYPPAVEALPKVGDFLRPNLETIVTLRPTLVIVDDIHGQTAGALNDHGLETIECAMHALPDVKHALEAIGARIGKSDKAKELIAEIDHDLDAAAAARPARHPKVLAVIDRENGGLGNLVVAGPGSYLDELLAVVGGDNVLAGSVVRYPKISLEEVLRSQPEVILDLSFGGKNKPDDWNGVDVPAVKNKKVYAMQQEYLTGPSPRVKAALTDLANALR